MVQYGHEAQVGIVNGLLKRQWSTDPKMGKGQRGVMIDTSKGHRMRL